MFGHGCSDSEVGRRLDGGVPVDAFSPSGSLAVPGLDAGIATWLRAVFVGAVRGIDFSSFERRREVA